MPFPVVPTLRPPRPASSRPSTTECRSKQTCARSEMKMRLPAALRPFVSSWASSLKKLGTWTTVPAPIRLIHEGETRPEGRMWKS